MGPPRDRPGEGTGVAVEYATVERDADYEEGDPADVEATLVRVPAGVERVDYFSSSWWGARRARAGRLPPPAHLGAEASDELAVAERRDPAVLGAEGDRRDDLVPA